MAKIRKLLTNFRVIILLSCLLLGLFAIYPNPWNEGVSIKSVARNSSAELAGMQNPSPKLSPMAHEKITAINNKPIADLQEYYATLSNLKPNQTVQIKTNKAKYTLLARPKYNVTTLNETETVYINETAEVNQTINGTRQTINKTTIKKVERPKTQTQLLGIEPLGLSVENAPTSNLRKGLDLQGGTRVVLKPTQATAPEVIEEVIETLKERLNIYGLGDVIVNSVSGSPELFGGAQRYILVEVAGATEDEVRKILESQGKFEAKIGNDTVFRGGKDITYVCRTAQCSGLDPNRGCGKSPDGYACAFMFSITLNPDAAQRQADLTNGLLVQGDSLSEQLVLFLDDQEVDRLSISADLRGRAVTDIAISGGGSAPSEEGAMENTLSNMKRLQTILKTGSLPVKLEIERIDSISPSLGKEFLTNAFNVGLLSLLGVTAVLIAVYRKIVIALPIMFTAVSEVFLTLSVAALIGWNIDLAAIAGIILAVGMGVNDQIIITDEAIKKEAESAYNWKDRIKRAFFIIMSAYFTQLVAMVPLFFAGAGLLKGFAVTTILAISVGVFITRPAYAAIVQKLVED